MIQLLDRVQPEAARECAIRRWLQEEDPFGTTVHQGHGTHEAGFAQQVNIVAGAKIGSIFRQIVS